MTAEEILERNKLIAEFMGYELNKYDYYLFPGLLPQFRGSDHAEWCSTQEIQIDWDNLKDIELYEKTGGYYWEISSNHLCYESSWNWLMSVVEKIESITMGTIIPVFEVVIRQNKCVIESHPQWDYYGKLYSEITIREDSKIKSTWLAIIEFIKWYDAQKL